MVNIIFLSFAVLIHIATMMRFCWEYLCAEKELFKSYLQKNPQTFRKPLPFASSLFLKEDFNMPKCFLVKLSFFESNVNNFIIILHQQILLKSNVLLV